MRTYRSRSPFVLATLLIIIFAFYAYSMFARYGLTSLADAQALIGRGGIDTQFLLNIIANDFDHLGEILRSSAAQLPLQMALGVALVFGFFLTILSIIIGKKVTIHVTIQEVIEKHIQSVMRNLPGYKPSTILACCIRCGRKGKHSDHGMFYFGKWIETSRYTTSRTQISYRTESRYNNITGENEDVQVRDDDDVTTTHIFESFHSYGRFPLYLCSACSRRIILADRVRGGLSITPTIIPRLIGVALVWVILLFIWDLVFGFIFQQVWNAPRSIIFDQLPTDQRNIYIGIYLLAMLVALILAVYAVFSGIADPLKRPRVQVLDDFLLRTAEVLIRVTDLSISTSENASRER